MGFFDTLKSMKNSITGGAAKVYLDVAPAALGEPVEFMVRAEVQDADLKISRVYLEIEGREEVEVPDTDVVYEIDGVADRRTEIVRANYVTAQLEVTVSEGQELEANSSHEWTVSVELPVDALPSYRGHYCSHGYIARASLDCFGNDPDSGWVEVHI